MDSDIKVIDLEPEFRADRLRVPLKFGSVTVTESTSLIVKATVETKKGQVAEGLGAMPLAEKWSFPEPTISDEKKLAAMKLLGEKACKRVKDGVGREYGHPIDIMIGAKDDVIRISKEAGEEVALGTHLPMLSILVSTSPIDAALHDAFGRANGICSYEGYGKEYMKHDLSFYLGERFRGKFISDFIRPRYVDELPVFHLVGALDKLTSDEVDESDPKDGLPVTLEEWIRRDGVFCLKVKLSGTDVDWDVRRTKAVAEVASEALRRKGVEEFHLSADANEMNPDPDATLEYLMKLRRASPMAFEKLLYLEQPTERDLGRHMFRMDKVAKVKPVLADEGVTDLESYDLALSLGWSGVAVKTCKWHSSSLIHISRMEHDGVPYSIQDLTCPGWALVHSAGLAARSRPMMGFEYNARQYLPFAYCDVQERHGSLFRVKDGRAMTESIRKLGLGFALDSANL